MSTFTVTVTRLRAVETHPNADRLEMAQIGDYRCCVLKGSFHVGDLVAYIPEAALLPDPVLIKLNMKGSSLLAGKDNTRVKAIKLRGELSQGICYPVEPGWVEGQDVADLLGITKYTPPIPTHMAGQVWAVGREHTWNYDIENVKAWPEVLQEGEDVVFSEKLHGTWQCCGLVPVNNEILQIVSSKGLFEDGLALKLNEENALNIYVRVATHLKVFDRLLMHFGHLIRQGCPVYLFGETYPVQDLKYGASANQDETLGFRVFDIYLGDPHRGRYLNEDELEVAVRELGLPRVPVLYRGPFSKAVMLQHTDGMETVSGQALHLREGIVIAPSVERVAAGLGRVKLKSVSPAYLVRKKQKGATAEEPTEFE